MLVLEVAGVRKAGANRTSERKRFRDEDHASKAMLHMVYH